MPLLLHSNYSDLDQNLLNKVKKKINKSAEIQYKDFGNIRSTIRPTQSQVDSNFLSIVTFLGQIYSQMNMIYRSGRRDNAIVQTDIATKFSIDFTPKISKFITEYTYNIKPNYNYFSPRQNELIKESIIKIRTIVDELETEGTTFEVIGIINEFLDQLLTLQEDVENYSPLKISNIPTQTLTGGYIGAGRIYPKTRFL